MVGVDPVVLLDSLRGHSDIVQRLLSAWQRKHLASTYLFVGPDGVGRRLTAQALAQVFVCESKNKKNKACGFCGACLRAVKHQCEYILEIAPEKNQIKIEQAHQVLEFLSLKSSGPARVVIIDSAHLLNPQAANSLLKTLEEPPDDCYFFLIAPSVSHVLPTIRSRSQVVRFPALHSADIAKLRPAPEWALQSALGSVSRLLGYLDPEEIQTRKEAFLWIEKLVNESKQSAAAPDLFYLLDSTKEFSRDRSSLLALARHWVSILRDALLWQMGERERLMNTDQSTLIQKLSLSNSEILHLILKQLFELESELNSQKDSALSFEKFWIRSKDVLNAN